MLTAKRASTIRETKESESTDGTSQAQLEDQLAQAALVTDLAATNRQLINAGLSPLPQASIASIPILLQYVRNIAAAAAANAVTAKQSQTSLKKQLKHARSQSNLLELSKKDYDNQEKTIKELTRKLAIAEDGLENATRRCADLEKEIWTVRKDFLNGTNGVHGSKPQGALSRKSTANNLRQSFQQQRRDSAVVEKKTPKPEAEPAIQPRANEPVVDVELEEAEIARKAADIARRFAASNSHDSSSLHTAQFAAGKATSMAESALLSHSQQQQQRRTTSPAVVVGSYASAVTSGVTTDLATNGVESLPCKHVETELESLAAVEELVDEYTLIERKPSNRRSRRLAKPVISEMEENGDKEEE